MQYKYYTLPLNAVSLIKNKPLVTCNIQDSIANYIHLIMTTRFGECNFDSFFGCAIWNVDFNNIASDNKLRVIISDSLIKSIKQYEKRLLRIEVQVDIEQEEVYNKQKKSRIKKRVYVLIKGVIKKTNEDFSYNEYFYIAPLSY